MSTLIAPTTFKEELKVKQLNFSDKHNNNNKYPRHVLKCKHSFKPKCDKLLKRKLRKYKLRKNGEEDPAVIDVSHIFLSSLKIKSPSKSTINSESVYNSEELRPKNYLFKMGRRKQKIKPEGSDPIVVNGNVNENGQMSVTPEGQEKKQTNAFKLLMDSRNKSIGTNSPGKDKICDPSEQQEFIEKRSIKVKRNLALQKMAEAKGALKRKELEEYQEKCINKKMEKRAERLKSMIASKKPKEKKNERKVNTDSANQDKEVVETLKSDSKPSKNKKSSDVESKSKTLQLVDIFKDVIKPNNISPDKKVIPKEDEEFLNKLSPSIKKKENMLCYFRKIERKSDTSLDVEDGADNASDVIKVKVSVKSKKSMKKKKLSLSKESANEILKDHNVQENINNDINNEADSVNHVPNGLVNENSSNERKKRKRKENLAEIEVKVNKPVTIDAKDALETEERRSKRNIKRPVKYVDDVLLSSSDDELHIFTPKKRKHCENKTKQKEISNEIIVSDEGSKKNISKPAKNIEKEEKTQKKATKLAPIFVCKPQLNPEQIEAKQKFLYSGVPDQIKKIIAQQKNVHIETNNDFPAVVHVQQKVEPTILTPVASLPDFLENNSDEDIFAEDDVSLLSKLFISSQLDVGTNTTTTLSSKLNTTAVLQNIKERYPKFPVYRTFRLLKSKSKGEFKECIIPELDNSVEAINGLTDILNENPEYLNWTDKFKATSSKHLIGNFESIKEIKRWLQSWTENEAKRKNTLANTSDSSDFYDSDSNSKDSIRSLNNLLLLTGPIGCGKTSAVYAVATELAIKVIEVNASSKRTGKVMLQDLQEATQSHKVNRAGIDNSQKSQEIVEIDTTKVKKRGRPKKVGSLKKSSSKDEMLSQKTASQDSTRTGMSLILVDDADIVFDQDDGFASAISQLTQTSKRPVILVTRSLAYPHLQKFVQCGKIINMHPLAPRMLGTWLDIMCLADTGTCWSGLGAKVLDYFKGDIRKSINCLQFYVTSYAQDCLQDEATSQNSEFKSSLDDENSNISWADNEENQIPAEPPHGAWGSFMGKEMNLRHLRYPLHLLNVWWSVPTVLNEIFNGQRQFAAVNSNISDSKHDELKRTSELESIANVIDAFSFSDYYSSKNPDTGCNITSKPWYSSESDSVSESENLENYTKHHEVTNDIIQDLIAGYIDKAQTSLQCERNTMMDFPDMAAQREKDRIVSRHDNLTTILNPSAVLDRRGLALDYWSTCRTICRTEKMKVDIVSKRHNRFCHYLKSLNSMGRNDAFDSLADSLNFKGKDE